MADDKFDAIIVGAGPAGVSAAITMAKAGLNVALLERGEYAGAKNVQGAVIYSKMLQDVVPEFWKDCPLERALTEERVWIMTDDSAIQVGVKACGLNTLPANSYTIIRVQFDRWFAKKAEEAGVTFVTGVTVNDLIRENGAIVGVKTTEGDELRADVVVACDGVNSILAQKAGLTREWKSTEVALGVKEVLALPREKIEERFCLEGNQGATTEMIGDITKGMLGYAFMYTNKESISIGLGCAVDEFQRTNIRPYELLDELKRHPLIRPYIAGAQILEYSAHLIPEGGFNVMPQLYTDGMLVSGDAAQMINPTHREGSNLAMAAGRLAGETVIEAKKKGDYSKRTLALYRKKLEDSFIMQDLEDHKDIEDNVRKNREMLTIYPKLLNRAAHEYLLVDGLPKRMHQKRIIQMFRKERGLFRMARDMFSMRSAIG